MGATPGSTLPRRDSAIRHLEQLLDHYTQITTALSTTLTLLQSDHEKAARPKFASVVGVALAHEVKRVAGGQSLNGHRGLGPAAMHAAGAARVGKRRGRPPGKAKAAKKKPGRHLTGLGTKKAVRARRQRTASFLAIFNKTAPLAPKGKAAQRGLGSLVRRGYLLKQDDGYVRSDKDFVV